MFSRTNMATTRKSQSYSIMILTSRSVVTLLTLTLMCGVVVPDEHSEQCEYNIDLANHRATITCKGSTPATVNVYADSANVQADQVRQEGGTSGGAMQTMDNRDNNGNHESKSRDRNQKDGTGYGESRKYEYKEHFGTPKPRTDPNTHPVNSKDYNMPSRFSDPPHKHRHGSWKDPLPKPAFDQKYAEYVWNATRKLDKAKRQLSTYSDSIQNTTNSLAIGDLQLRDDMKALKNTRNSATELKDGIIAAMRNQYNFIRSTLLVRNNELKRLVESLTTLVGVTSDGLHTALDAHKRVMDEMVQVNHTLISVRRLVRDEMKRKAKSKAKGKTGKPKDTCPKQISAIGSGTARIMDTPQGAYLTEAHNPSDFRPVYVMKGAGPSDQLMQYDADQDVTYNLVARYYSLPYNCVGTGHAVFKRHFYCHIAGTATIIKYHLKRMDIVAEMDLTGATWGGVYPYSGGGDSDIDLAVDEMGIWALYASNSSGGNLVIAKLNHRLMEVERSWVTRYPKREIGQAVVICGVLYALNSHADTPTYIRYVFDTQTEQEQLLEPGVLPFANVAHVTGDAQNEIETGGYARRKEKSNVSFLSYDFRTSNIYSWNNGRLEAFPVYFHDST